MRLLRDSAFLLLFLLGFNSCTGRVFSSKAPIVLQKAWASDNTLRTPESALYAPAERAIYVSNINAHSGKAKDGDGFISRLNADGKMEQLHWAAGLNDPHGIALYNRVLYVADIDEIVAISTQTGAILGKYKADGAEYLNDVAVDSKGTVYVSDMKQKRIYQLQNGRVSTWVNNTRREQPNGLFVKDDRLVVAFNSSGNVRFINLDTRNFTNWTEGIPSADGIAELSNGNFLISSWEGEIFYVNKKGRKWQVLDTRSEKINSADISFDYDSGILLIPTFKDNRVLAYRVLAR
ncbi:gluconolaconase [Pontibacter sp. E15-1]|uniref:SMP-30/gluconolactonase/LRE family protein n=1 Tax=Pontibacter sp. E15-1 TaxID=2919918 RepID=UPI001F4F1293|nr:gluconolaconase [Pontibacter sp. E15-1]MCJ8167059.1 gluconolaconase [Pontibacter sp. E15-1]